jgi:hypothetical protein
MVQVDFSGDFLNYDSSQDGDICTILNECKLVYNETLKKDMWDMEVEHNKKTKTFSPNNKSGNALVDAFGKDSKDWIGQQFEVVHIDKKMSIRPIKKKA